MKRSGFSLIELIMAIVLVAILAAVLSPMIFKGGATVNLGAAARKLGDDIRYAQALAMARHKLPTPSSIPNPSFRYRMEFDTGTDTYTIVNDADNDDDWGEAGESVKNPSTGENSFSVQLNSGEYAGIEITPGGFGDSYLEFDTFGAPYGSGGKLTAPASLTLTASGETATITVTPATGKVTVQ
ncbi:MAG: prepilin-type N-terminal cleavage/methylation domain-containing protein [Thermodesulfobacteriota bacterium]